MTKPTLSINPPRILIAASSSGSGKTTITCGLLAAFKKRGISVQSYKIGPDYIDPGYHTAAAGRTSHNLDTWLTGEDTMKKIFAESAANAEISVIEGVMGLYDGGRGGISSTAQIAKLLHSPVLLVIDSKSMGESAAAIAAGFRDYDKDVNLCGVILNRLGSENHKNIICDAMAKIGIPVVGTIFRSESFKIPERHLGLLPAEENSDKELFAEIEKEIEKNIDLDKITELAAGAEPFEISPFGEEKSEAKVRIAAAKDEAFSFYYPESLRELERAGAEIVFFSPLHDKELPHADGLIFGGGFPEMFAEELSSNTSMKMAISDAALKNMPIYAECGGFMYLTQSITDFDGIKHEMVGIVPASCQMNGKLRTVGYVEAEALDDNVICKKGTLIRGHEFHFSSSVPDDKDTFPHSFLFRKTRTGEEYKAGYAKDSILASYLHMHLAGNPQLARNFVLNCEKYSKSGRS